MRRSLQDNNLADVLRELIESSSSGLLFLQHDGLEKGLYLRAGRLVGAESNVREEGLGYRLLDQGLLSPTDLQAALPQVEPGRTLADVLRAAGKVREDALQRAIRAQVEAIIISAFDLTRASYMFQAGDFSHKGALPLNSAALILEGVRRMFNFDRVRDRLLSNTRALTAVLDPSAIALEPTEGFILSRIDGVLTAADICSLSIISEDMTCRILYGLIAAGAIRYGGGAPAVTAAAAPQEARRRPAAPTARPSPPKLPGASPSPSPSPAPGSPPAPPAAPLPARRVDRLPPEPPAARTPAASSPAVARAGPRVEPYRPGPSAGAASGPRTAGPRVESYRPEPSAPAAGSPRVERFTPEATSPASGRAPRVESWAPDSSSGGVDAAHGARTAEIESLFEELAQRDPHAILGVPPGAPAAAIAQAFHALKRRFHPNENGWITDEALRSKLVFVFARIAAAYQALSGNRDRGGRDDQAPHAVGITGDSNIRMEFSKTERQRELEERIKKSTDLYREAKLLYDQQRYHDVRERLRQAIAIYDHDSRFFALAARVAMLNPNMRWQKDAENYWRRAIELDRWNAEYRVGLGLQYKSAGMAQKAKKEFIAALELDPNNSIALAEVPWRERPKRREVPLAREEEDDDAVVD